MLTCPQAAERLAALQVAHGGRGDCEHGLGECGAHRQLRCSMGWWGINFFLQLDKRQEVVARLCSAGKKVRDICYSLLNIEYSEIQGSVGVRVCVCVKEYGPTDEKGKQAKADGS